MANQTATTGELENAAATVIAKVRYTAEHNAPCVNLIEQFTMGKGEKAITVPKVGQVNAHKLVDGVDLTETEDIGMSTTDLTTSEVGLKFILTDRLVRQQVNNVWAMVGRQGGDAIARIQDTDIIALFSGFSNTAGLATKGMSFANWSGCAAIIKNLKALPPVSCVHHPYAVYALMKSVSSVGSYPVPDGLSADLLKNFWAMTFDNIGVFHDGNIVPDASADAVGAFFSKSALGIVKSLAPTTEKERDASLRATELVYVTEYGVYELDDGQGLAVTFDAATPTTSA